jgi:hypothetical protein
MTDQKMAAFVCEVGLPGWRLHVAQLTARPGRDLGNVMEMAIEGAFKHLQRSFPDGDLARSETVTLVREHLGRLGIDSKANPPCSELLLDRGNLKPPLRFTSGERGLPVLEDQNGVVDSPWIATSPADLESCSDPVFICYLPEELFRTIDPKSHLGRVVWLTFAFQFIFERSFSFKR